VLAIGRMRYDAILPCIAAAIVADQVGLLWGIHHTHYVVSSVAPITAWSLIAAVVAGIVFGLIGMAFDGTTTPLHLGFLAAGVVALALAAIVERGRLFRPA
jgi:H+/Cl- antiporter ClcA